MRCRPGRSGSSKIKHDGYRFICQRDNDRVRIFSRRGNDYTDRVPAIAETLRVLRVKSVTLDGEGVVCGSEGVTDGGPPIKSMMRMSSLIVIISPSFRKCARHADRHALAPRTPIVNQAPLHGGRAAAAAAARVHQRFRPRTSRRS